MFINIDMSKVNNVHYNKNAAHRKQFLNVYSYSYLLLIICFFMMIEARMILEEK